METITYRGVEFEIDNIPERPPVFVFGVRKSGSSLLNSITEALANFNKIKYVDIAGRLYLDGVPVKEWMKDPDLQTLIKGGNVFAGFRDFPHGLMGNPTFSSAKKILLVRDPRDALVSEYFSNAKTHKIPDSGESRTEMLALRQEANMKDITAFVLDRAKQMAETIREYYPIVTDKYCKVFRYEDIIFKKQDLITGICEHFGWRTNSMLINHIIEWADVIPSQEDQGQFIRKVVPGDYHDKLTAEVISKLNEILSDTLNTFNYVK